MTSAQNILSQMLAYRAGSKLKVICKVLQCAAYVVYTTGTVSQ